MRIHAKIQVAIPKHTGMKYDFLVTTRNGKEEEDTQIVSVVETSIADCWYTIGKTIRQYMKNGGQKVMDIQLLT